MCAQEFRCLKLSKTFLGRFKTQLQDWPKKGQMTGLSKTFSVATSDCDEVIFHKASLGAFHTSIFTITVATAEVINFVQGKYITKTKPLFEGCTPIPLRIKDPYLSSLLKLRGLIQQQLSPCDHHEQEGFPTLKAQ